jgi:hypothetical protein
MTTNNVVSDQHSVVIQNQTTGQVDFLRFNGSSLQASALRDYGIAGWNVVANGDFGGPAGTADGFIDLVVQNQSSGQLDFLWLNGSANLIGSALGPVVPHVVGSGFFGGPTFTVPTGQVGNTIVSQLANGQFDFLGFNGHGGLIASDLVANTVGLPTAVGVAESATNWPVFANNGATGNDNVLVQDAAGNLIAIGFTGSTASGGLTYSNSFSRGPLGDSIFAVDQDNNFGSRDANVVSIVDGVTRETFDAVGVNLATGRIDIHSWASGYGDLSHEGVSLGTINTNFSLSAGWQVVDAGLVDHVSLLPLA